MRKKSSKLNVQAYKREHDYCTKPSAVYKRRRLISECETFGTDNSKQPLRARHEADNANRAGFGDGNDNTGSNEGSGRVRTVSTTSTTSCTSSCSQCDHSSSSSSSSTETDSSWDEDDTDHRRRRKHGARRSWLPRKRSYRRRQRDSESSQEWSGTRDSGLPGNANKRRVTTSYKVDPQERLTDEHVKARDEQKREEVRDAMTNRRILFVGDLPPGTSRNTLHNRFKRFGEIEKITLHQRDDHTHYGFITFKYKCDAFRAKEEGNDNLWPSEPTYNLNFGGRRFFCGEEYKDFDDNGEEEEYLGDYDYDATTSSQQAPAQYSGYGGMFGCNAETDFDALLQAAKSSVQRK